VVARQLWSDIFEVLDIDAGSDFVSIGTLWLIRNKKFLVANISCSAALRGALEAEKLSMLVFRI
jgi:hypothetical protein